jgi:putative SOS response-associated peptidase YedK
MAARGQDQATVLHSLRSREPFAFAGLAERWSSAEQPIDSAAIITTEANPLMATIHDRMPVILPPEAYGLWLDPEFQGRDELLALLRPFPDDAMDAIPVSDLVNKPANDYAECIAPQPTALF